MLAALDAARVHHNLLAVLEASDVCHDTDLTLAIQQRIAKALLDRDEAQRVLNDHERWHAKQASG